MRLPDLGVVHLRVTHKSQGGNFRRTDVAGGVVKKHFGLVRSRRSTIADNLNPFRTSVFAARQAEDPTCAPNRLRSGYLIPIRGQ